MAIEDIMKAHIEALNNHAAVMEKFLAAGGTSAKPADTKAAAPKAAAKKTTTASKKKDTKPLVDQIAETAGEYMRAGDADDRKAAVENVKAIVDHFGADRLTNIDEEHHEQVLALLKSAAAGEELDLPEEGDDGSII